MVTLLPTSQKMTLPEGGDVPGLQGINSIGAKTTVLHEISLVSFPRGPENALTIKMNKIPLSPVSSLKTKTHGVCHVFVWNGCP